MELMILMMIFNEHIHRGCEQRSNGQWESNNAGLSVWKRRNASQLLAQSARTQRCKVHALLCVISTDSLVMLLNVHKYTFHAHARVPPFIYYLLQSE